MADVVGVAIANFNNEKFLAECLDSILAQSYDHVQTLVVDDCSSDRSVEILRDYSRSHSSINFLINEKNRGVVYTRERAIRNLHTDLIMTLDSDDYLVSAQKVELEANLLAKKNGYQHVAFSLVHHMDEQGNEYANPFRCVHIEEGEVFENLLTMNCFVPRDFIYAKKLHFEVGPYDPEIPIYEDWDLKLRLARVAQFHCTGEQGVAYRQHKSGLSYVKRAEHLAWMNHVFWKNADGLQNKDELHRLLLKNERKAHIGNYKNRLRRLVTGEVSLARVINERIRRLWS